MVTFTSASANDFKDLRLQILDFRFGCQKSGICNFRLIEPRRRDSVRAAARMRSAKRDSVLGHEGRRGNRTYSRRSQKPGFFVDLWFLNQRFFIETRFLCVVLGKKKGSTFHKSAISNLKSAIPYARYYCIYV